MAGCNDWKVRCAAVCHFLILWLAVSIGIFGVRLCNIKWFYGWSYIVCCPACNWYNWASIAVSTDERRLDHRRQRSANISVTGNITCCLGIAICLWFRNPSDILSSFFSSLYFHLEHSVLVSFRCFAINLSIKIQLTNVRLGSEFLLMSCNFFLFSSSDNAFPPLHWFLGIIHR